MRAQWIIVDSAPGRVMSLLHVGCKAFKGVSVRKNLSRRARELLYEPLEAAVLHGVACDDERLHEGQRWRVVVEPILSPMTSTPVGARGIYVGVEEQVPPAPEVGSMEWVFTADGHRSSEWDRTLYGIYELDRDDPALPEGHPGGWLAQYVAREDQARLIKLIATAADGAQLSDRQIVAYRIVTARSKQKKLLQMSASMDRDGAGRVYLRGFTREIPVLSIEGVLSDEVGDFATTAEAWSDLLADIPLARIDWLTYQLFEVSQGWHEAGLADPGGSSLLEVVHEDHRRRVEAVMETCQEHEAVARAEQVPVRTRDGEQRVVDLTFRSLPSRYGIMRVHPCG